ncbi:aspartate-semialdehyde dehydrogenase [Paenisporosarcina cavernae]|uniref:Aspartate-semialdehyde dehydrogenase n=1 Tax=Paenisporosarcina cavernae TaxID=2320858 RepID=A0A385YSJ8_9BACL|nr:aspartate-semialdehyde dehydrogenase [Paenisporosarcina cavernae]AYC29290.1 aspartate-semialdehyde dehydrogenase [Paenisporosarcina cavernae]
MEKKYRVAIVGATGAVGEKMKEQLEKRQFPISSIKFLASKRSVGKEIFFQHHVHFVEEATPEAFEGIDIAFFSAGGSVSKELAKEAAKRGAVVIDNTSAFRMEPTIPLVVPEVNKKDLHSHQGIISNPNCSTIQLVCVLEPIRQALGLTKVIISTYQAVSGAGSIAVQELVAQNSSYGNRLSTKAEVLPVKSGSKHYPIAYNAIPQIDQFGEDGFTLEEWKMMNETKKILHDPTLAVSATCVRLPVVAGHSESVYIEIEKENCSVEEVKTIIQQAPGVQLLDNPAEQEYPMPLFSEGKDDVFVGRIRRDPANPKGFHLWIVADNLLKGAALNSIQIAEALMEEGLV